MIAATCPDCHHAYEVDDDLAGKGVLCPECRSRFRVRPAAKAPASAPLPEKKVEDDGAGYRCPYCGTRKRWVIVRRRTLMAKIVFVFVALTSLSLVARFVDWAFQRASEAGAGEIAVLTLLGSFVGVLLALLPAWHFVREEAQVCPACKTRIAG